MPAEIKETQFTPAVVILYKDHRVAITGQSRLEDPAPFYDQLSAFLDESIQEFKTHLTIDFRLNYLNSSSSKCLFHMLKGLQTRFQGKKLITINWFADRDDDSMIEAGEVFQSLLSIPFNVLSTTN